MPGTERYATPRTLGVSEVRIPRTLVILRCGDPSSVRTRTLGVSEVRNPRTLVILRCEDPSSVRVTGISDSSDQGRFRGVKDALASSGFGRLSPELDFDEFVAICADPTGGVATPTASAIDRGIPIYDGAHLRRIIGEGSNMAALRDELAAVFGAGAGVVAIRNAWADTATLNAMTDVLWQIVERERAGDRDQFDHFAASGANSRAWDTLGKAAKLDPRYGPAKAGLARTGGDKRRTGRGA